MISYSEAAERADRGARFLDERHPGWHEVIDLSELYMDYSCSCIIGQIHGSFWNGMRREGFVSDLIKSARQLGFHAADEDYPRLQEAWVLEILYRRNPLTVDQVSQKKEVVLF